MTTENGDIQRTRHVRRVRAAWRDLESDVVAGLLWALWLMPIGVGVLVFLGFPAEVAALLLAGVYAGAIAATYVVGAIKLRHAAPLVTHDGLHHAVARPDPRPRPRVTAGHSRQEGGQHVRPRL